MKISIAIVSLSILLCSIIKDKSSPTFSTQNSELEKDTISLTLNYYGWGCPCPQWITAENIAIIDSQDPDSTISLDLFYHIKPINENVSNPFDLTGDYENISFIFTGQFFKEPQFLGVEGESSPAKTFLYHSVEMK